MKQDINILPHEKQVSNKLTYKHFVILWIMFTGFLFTFVCVGYYKNMQNKKALFEIVQNQKHPVAPSNKKSLKQSIDNDKLIQAKVSSLKALQSQVEPSAIIFSELVSLLMNHERDGLQFDKINIHQGGAKLSILGVANYPAQIPDLIAKLSENNLLENRYKYDFRIRKINKKTQVTQFNLNLRLKP